MHGKKNIKLGDSTVRKMERGQKNMIY